MSNLNDLLNAMEKYSGGQGGGFFTLKDDKDTAVVRFLHTDGEDLDWYVLHSAEISGKRRNVKCLEDASCPLCASGNKPRLRLFLQVEHEKEVKVWERGQKFIPQILGFINKYGDLNNRKYEIERHGKKGDTSTTYSLYPLDKDEPSNLPQRQQLLAENGLVMDLSIEAMQAVADGTYSPQKSDTQGKDNIIPERRRERSVEDTF